MPKNASEPQNLNLARGAHDPPSTPVLVIAHELRHRLVPMTRRETGESAILLTREHGIDGPLRDEALHAFELCRADAVRFHWKPFRAAAIERPLRVFLPTAFASVRKMEQARCIRVREKRLEQLGKVE